MKGGCADMSHNYRDKRGVNCDNKPIDLQEQRRQWNSALAQRTLENLFGEVTIDENTTIQSSLQRATYNAETLYKKANEYFHNILDANESDLAIIPDIEDFCMYANISRATFKKYSISI